MKNPRSVTLEKFRGIYNASDAPPERTRENPGTWLKEAYNWEPDANGLLLKTRSGYALKASGAFHSLFPYSTRGILADYNKRLCIVYPDESYRAQILLPVTSGEWWSYVRVADKVWATNNSLIGYIQDYAWHELPDVTQTFKHKMPAGHIIEYYRGRLWVALGNIIICSDPAAYHFYDIREDSNLIMRPSRIRMMRSVTNGLWISDDEGLYFYGGNSPEEMERIVISDTPAIFGTDRKAEGISISGDFMQDVVMVATTNGVKFLGDSGKVLMTSEQNFVMPNVTRGCSTIKKTNTGSQYQVILQ